MGEGGIAKGGGQGGGDGHEEEGNDDTAAGEYRCCGGALGGVKSQVEVAHGGREERLHRVEEDGELE